MPNITDVEKKYIEHSLGKDRLPEQVDLRKKVRNVEFNTIVFQIKSEISLMPFVVQT